MANNKAALKMADKILEMLDQGEVAPWRKTWVTARPTNLQSKRPYSGINVFMLAFEAADKGYKSQYWLTFNGAVKAGGKVRKGEKGTPIIFARQVVKNKGRDDESSFFFYNVTYAFNVEQCEGIEIPAAPHTDNKPIEACETIVQNMPDKPSIVNGLDPLYYPLKDRVEMPALEQFETPEAYYATLFHELGHSTGHKSRLDRDLKPLYEKEKYGKEELIAELCASMLCGHTGIEPSTVIDNAAAYVESWRKTIKADKGIVVKAASMAQKAFDFITGQKVEKPKEKAAKSA